MVESRRLNRGFLYSILVYIGASYGLAYLGVAEDWSLYTSLAVTQAMIILPLLLVFLCHKKNPFAGIRWKIPPVLAFPLILLVTVCCYPLIALCNMISMLFTTNTASELSLLALDAPLWKNFLFMAVLPACMEELMFRGMYFHGYRKAGVWKGIFLSALLFGLMHMNANQFCYAFVLGVIMALVVEATGSLWSSVFVHLLVNGFSVVVLWLESTFLGTEELQQLLESTAGLTMAEQYSPAELLPMILVVAVVALIGLGFAMIFFCLLSVVCKRNEYVKALLAGKVESEEKGRLISLPLILAVAIALLYMVIYL